MKSFTEILISVAEQLFTKTEMDTLADLAALDQNGLYKWDQLFMFDMALGGPGVHNIHDASDTSIGALGRYYIEDRDVFRPLQYCAVYLHMRDPLGVPWLTRDIIHMAGLHLESLAKRVVGNWSKPLGWLLGGRDSVVRNLVGPEAWRRLVTFTDLYNAAKHTVNQTKDTHLFDPGDAVLAYFVSRRLAEDLFPHARIKTPESTWKVAATTKPQDPIW